MKIMKAKSWLFAVVAGTVLFASVPVFADSCADCHGDPALKVKSKKLHDYFQAWKGSDHDKAGLSCADCHGGDVAATVKETAHIGIRPPSDGKSRLHYLEVPETCGACHKPVYNQFAKSKHYKKLQNHGIAPNCVTCHGSMNSATNERAILAANCSACHNEETKNRPEIIEQAETIIGRLSYAEGYRKWAKFYYKSIGKSEKLETIDPLYENIVAGWHGFDFRQLEYDSTKLLKEVKALFDSLSEERHKKEEAD